MPAGADKQSAEAPTRYSSRGRRLTGKWSQLLSPGSSQPATREGKRSRRPASQPQQVAQGPPTPPLPPLNNPPREEDDDYHDAVDEVHVYTRPNNGAGQEEETQDVASQDAQTAPIVPEVQGAVIARD